MSPFEQVYLRILGFFVERAESSDVVTSGSLANKFGISGAYLSRMRNGRSGLSDEVIDKITLVLKDLDESFANEIRGSLERAQEETRSAKTTPRAPGDALKPIEDFFVMLESAEHALLCIDFRDNSPQFSAIPHLAELVGSAVSNGLSLALFQPFGPKSKLLEKHSNYIRRISDTTAQPHHTSTAQAYYDLFKLAEEVETVAAAIKKRVENNVDRVVLYEAERKDNDLPLNAIGIQSRLFYARFQINNQWSTRVFDWVTGLRRSEHFFIERNSRDVSFDVVKAQFHPIPKFWQENDFRLPQARDLNNNYISDKWNVRWEATS